MLQVVCCNFSLPSHPHGNIQDSLRSIISQTCDLGLFFIVHRSTHVMRVKMLAQEGMKRHVQWVTLDVCALNASMDITNSLKIAIHAGRRTFTKKVPDF